MTTVSNIGRFIDQQLITGEVNRSSMKRHIVKKTLQGLGLIPIIVGRAGMAMICLEGAKAIMGEENHTPLTLALGISSATGASVTFGCFSVFNTFNLIDELTQQHTEEEEAVYIRTVPKWKATTIATSSVGIGLIAHVAMAYAAYESATFLPLVMYLGQQLDFGRAANSTYLTLTDIFRDEIPFKTDVEKQLKATRDTICAKIADCKAQLAHDKGIIEQEFRTICPQVGRKSGDKSSSTKLITRSTGEYVDYVSLILKGAKDKGDKKSLSESDIFWCHAVTALSALGIYAEFFALGKAGAKEMWDQPLFYYTAGAVVLAANTYIWGTLIKKCSYVCTRFLRGTLPKSTEADLEPGLYRTVSIAGFGLALPVFVPQMFFAKVYMPPEYYLPVGISASVGGLLGGFATAIGLRDRVIRFIKDEHPRIEFDRQLSRLDRLLKGAGPMEIAKFLSTLPDELRNELASPALNEIQSYINIIGSPEIQSF